MARNIMRAFKLNEISAVDRPAQAPARMAIIKREFSAEERRDDARSGAAESDGSFPIENATDLHNAMRAVGRSKNPAKTRAHIRARARALGLESELSDAFKRADDTQESIMDKELLKALGLPENADVAAVLAAIAKRDSDAAAALAKANADLEIAKADMSDAERKHHDGLKDEDAKKAFRALAKADRAKEIEQANELPEHVRKALAEADEVKKRLAVLEGQQEVASFRKQAVEAGMPEAEAETLQKAYRGDKGAVDALVKTIAALNKQVREAGLFKEIGGRGTDGGVSAMDELHALATELRKREPNLTQEQAFSKVFQDTANAALAKRALAE